MVECGVVIIFSIFELTHHHRIGDRKNIGCSIVEEKSRFWDFVPGCFKEVSFLGSCFDLTKRRVGDTACVMTHCSGYAVEHGIIGKMGFKNLLPLTESHQDMHDGGVVAFQRCSHVGSFFGKQVA